MAEEKVIWDENNVLVEPELKAHFEEASAAVLRTDAEAGNVLAFDLEAPARAQAKEGATSDPMTLPQPSSDPNQIPSEVTIAEEVPVGGTPSGGTPPPAPIPAPTPPSVIDVPDDDI